MDKAVFRSLNIFHIVIIPYVKFSPEWKILLGYNTFITGSLNVRSN